MSLRSGRLHAEAALRIEPSLERVQQVAVESLRDRWAAESPLSRRDEVGDGADEEGASREQGCRLVPLTHSFIDDCETPVSALLKLRALAPGSPSFLLESAEQGTRVGRFSFIGVQPRQVLRWSLCDDGDPYEIAAAAVRRFQQTPVQGRGDPPPFAGGAVGFFGYDLVRTVEPLGEPKQDTIGLPDMALMLTDALVVFDHLRHTITILANAEISAESDPAVAYANACERIVEIKRALHAPLPNVAGGEGGEGGESGPSAAHGAPERSMPHFQPNMPRAAFEEMVRSIVRYVYAGDAFQVVPSQRWSAEVPVQALSIYRGLRAINPSPYMYFIDFGDFQLVGASPEPLLTVSGSKVSTRPIAGTRRRGADAAEDERIAASLLEDEKERAEHVMLVDLGRNDLGRVCRPGSVTVEMLMAVEIYSHVMHIVSSVSGELKEGVSAMDALRSVLPAGTLSGAPKVRAMQIIDELEPVKRGGYGGAIGYLSYRGDLDTCIHIRTVVVKDGVAHIQAGGGTVAEAKPDYEYEESVAKSEAMMRAIQLAIEQPDWA